MIGLVKSIWESSAPEKRLASVRALAITIPEAQIPLFEAIVDMVAAGLRDDPGAITVVLVHGIRTDAAWHQLVREELKTEKSINVVPITYGFFTALGLFGPFRRGPVLKVARELRDVRRLEPKTRIVVIAHSYGTYIISQIMSEEVDIRFERIIFCGSIVPREFRWDIYASEHKSYTIVNDVGTKDFYPVLATCTTWGYGSSGRLGFQTTRVLDRFFPYGHSSFFTSDHIRNFWIPFITSGTIADSDWNVRKPKTPYLINILAKGPLATIALLGVTACVVWGASRWFW